MNALLTDIEVATELRKSPSTVKRLRLSGRLAFVPGKPPLIRRDDLDAYLRRSLRTEPSSPRRRRKRR